MLATPDILAIGKSFASFAKQFAVLVADAKKSLDAADLVEKVCGRLIGDVGRGPVLHVHSNSKDHKDMMSVTWAFC